MGSKRMNSHLPENPENFGLQLDSRFFLLLICGLTQNLDLNPWPLPLHLNLLDDDSYLFGQEPNPV